MSEGVEQVDILLTCSIAWQSSCICLKTLCRYKLLRGSLRVAYIPEDDVQVEIAHLQFGVAVFV